jgi:hypothetical protein
MNLMASHEFGPFSKSRRNLIDKNIATNLENIVIFN